MRDSLEAKGCGCLTEARLLVTSGSGDHVEAECHGTGEVCRPGHEPGRGWWCSCPSKSWSQLHALQLVTIRRTR